MSDGNTLSDKAAAEIAKTVREVSRRMMNEKGHRGRWQWHGGGGGSQRIWFEISSVICNEDLTKTLNVTATHYTGGCTKAIPGEDEYGNIVIEDICGILNYYTQEWLESGGIKGSATYMYPREEDCEPLWLVDNVCGQPECA